jgi:hypothetical protein
VTFPVETRTCIHCGGPTSASGGHAALDLEMQPIGLDPVAVPPSRTGPTPVEPEEDAGTSSIFRSILNSLGAVVWIALFVIFSLARQCGE